VFKPGDVIAGKYAVERVIGMGGMGVVVAARHVELDEPVAIKMLLPHLPPSGEPAARFLREAKAAIKIKSDHVVRVLDVGRTEAGAPYIVMEYLEGCDLGQLVEKDGPLPVEDVVEYVMQACEAIAAAHALGIVHRDLKPANLFLARASDGSPCVKVLDFGISKIAEPISGHATGLTSTATVMGTPCFMSPEQLRSTRDVDARTDVWSMGAILHALMTGTPPYDGESNADVSAKIIRDAPTPLRELRPDVSPDLEAIVLRCLEKDPSGRFADVVSLAKALAQATLRPSSKASAERVARIATGAAPTVRALPDAPSLVASGSSSPGASPGPIRVQASGPTRTDSAWGDTRREEKRGRRIAGLIAATGIVVGLGIFGVLRWRADAGPHTVGALPSVAATAATTAAGAPAQSAHSAGSPPAQESASVVAPSATAATTATAAIAARAASTRPSPVKPGSSVTAPATAPRPVPSATATSKPGVGLFDGRE
jgi:serine/threonine-protein kinase